MMQLKLKLPILWPPDAKNRLIGKDPDAAFPLEWVRDGKLWPAVSRVDNGYGDRNLVTVVE